MNYSILLGSAALAAGVLMSGNASAVTVNRAQISHGTANCQSALPVFDGNIRKRPMAVANEGTSTAYVTCDSEQIPDSGPGFTGVGVYFVNRRGADGVSVSCTLADGAFVASAFFPKTTTIAAGASGYITWNYTADNAGAYFRAPATSCALPPGVDIALTQWVFPEDVGA